MELERIIENLREKQEIRAEYERESWRVRRENLQVRSLLNYTTGIEKLGLGQRSIAEIEAKLLGTATKLQEKLKGRTSLPSQEEIFFIYNTSLMTGNLRDIKRFNDYYPLLEFCYDEKFLIFTNYVLSRSYLSDEFKKDISELTKKIIKCSQEMIPIEGINNINVDKKAYNRLCRFTLSKIKSFEKSIKREEKAKDKILKKKGNK